MLGADTESGIAGVRVTVMEQVEVPVASVTLPLKISGPGVVAALACSDWVAGDTATGEPLNAAAVGEPVIVKVKVNGEPVVAVLGPVILQAGSAPVQMNFRLELAAFPAESTAVSFAV